MQKGLSAFRKPSTTALLNLLQSYKKEYIDEAPDKKKQQESIDLEKKRETPQQHHQLGGYAPPSAPATFSERSGAPERSSDKSKPVACLCSQGCRQGEASGVAHAPEQGRERHLVSRNQRGRKEVKWWGSWNRRYRRLSEVMGGTCIPLERRHGQTPERQASRGETRGRRTPLDATGATHHRRLSNERLDGRSKDCFACSRTIQEAFH